MMKVEVEVEVADEVDDAHNQKCQRSYLYYSL
jgi:hypothetical protein